MDEIKNIQDLLTKWQEADNEKEDLSSSPQREKRKARIQILMLRLAEWSEVMKS